jgi:release factor glutamine methyltransferase
LTVSTPIKKIWTILDLITWGTTYLTEKNFDEARLTVELLIAHVLQLRRIQLYTNFDKPLSEEELARFKELLKRRLTHEPLQYILASTEFMGLPFTVEPGVLIPRPETEILVEKIVEKISSLFPNEQKIRIAEVGSGSGCIAVSLAHFIPRAAITSMDISADAVRVAETNAGANNVAGRISFLHRDFFSVSENDFEEPFHCLVSNPPYISVKEYELLPAEVKNYEPKSALCDEGDGLKFYHRIAAFGQKIVEQKGFLAVEHSFDQSDDVQKIFQSHGWNKTTALQDYSGHFRCVFAERGTE